MKNVKKYLKNVMFLVKGSVLVGTFCLAMEPNTNVLLGMTREMYDVIAQQPALRESGAFHMFKKFNKDAESYKDPKKIWEKEEYTTIINNARNIFNELSKTEPYTISLSNAKTITENYFLEPEYNPGFKKSMYESWHVFKCTLLEEIQKKLNEKDILLQIPCSNSAAEFLSMNATIHPKHFKEFMAAMVILPWIVDIQKNTVNRIEKLVVRETAKMIISD